MFGLGADQSQSLDVVSKTQVTLRPDQLVFVTGASGKSTLLRLMAQGLAGRGAEGIAVIDFAGLALPTDRAVVDAVDDGRLPLDRVLKILSLTGLNDAFVMLRRPSELSDGQRYRFQLARTMARVEESLLSESNDTDNANDSGDSKNDAGTSGAASGPGLTVVLADEFGATLDRTTAAGVARNVRRWVNQSSGVCFVAATTHDDLLEPLAPDMLIEKHLGGGIDVVEVVRD